MAAKWACICIHHRSQPEPHRLEPEGAVWGERRGVLHEHQLCTSGYTAVWANAPNSPVEVE